MRSFVTWLFSSSGFVPRRLCGDWTRELVLLHNVSDALIWLSYVAIPIVLVTFARKRRDLPFPWMFVLFGAFIIGCGFTHFVDVVLFYVPVYHLSGVVKLITAIVSVATVVALVPIVPKALALRSPEELRREIEERVRAEAQLRHYARELQRSNRDLEDFASVASHDLQEPLRKIQSFGDRLESRYGALLGDDGRDSLARMVNASRRMAKLVEDLLAYSRVASKGEPFRPVALGRVAAEVVGDLEARIAQTGGTVEIGDLPTIRADASQMRQLFQNLIGNALKFHKPGEAPRVAIRSRALERPGQGAACEISVEDRGIGFDPKYLERIFDVFERLHGRNQYEGNGIGLAICRKIAERHGGEITATSLPDSGSTFLITLPFTSPEESGS